MVLVLDDLHDITNATVYSGLEFLLRHAPPSSAGAGHPGRPSLSLQRLLVGGQLSQVRRPTWPSQSPRWPILAACDDQPQLSDDDLALLQARTEGWAAGLRLAAMSLEGQPDPHQFVTEFAGDDKSIADYLTGEVLDRQPGGDAQLPAADLHRRRAERRPGRRPDRRPGRRVDAGPPGAGERVRDRGRVTAQLYRYHRLFAELLRYELRCEQPGQVVTLHRRAAGWYAERGLTLPAIQQALMAEDWRYAADLLAEHGPSLILGGRRGRPP